MVRIKNEAILIPSGRSWTLLRGGVEEDERDEQERHPALAPAPDRERDDDAMVEEGRVLVDVVVLDDVRCGVGGRERDGDDEVGRDEAEEDEDEELALPARQEVFEHRDGTLAVRALPRDAVVDGERAEEG